MKGKETKKILVVDDNPGLLILLKDTLNAIGYNSDSAIDGFDALDKLSNNKYDLVISDIMMPGLDGLGLLRKVRELYPGLPVLFITGVDHTEIIGTASPDGLLAKPFRVNHIESLIERTLAGKKSKLSGAIKNILVVDDDDPFREMLAEALTLNDFSPFAVAAADEALVQLEKRTFDAALVDIRMKGMDGIELTRNIKRSFPKLPVILMTAYMSDGQLKKQSQDSGASGYMEKPFDVIDVVKLLQSLAPISIDTD